MHGFCSDVFYFMQKARLVLPISHIAKMLKEFSCGYKRIGLILATVAKVINLPHALYVSKVYMNNHYIYGGCHQVI